MRVQLNKKTGWDLGIHVDGASGAFVAPFIDQDLEWDFRLKNVRPACSLACSPACLHIMSVCGAFVASCSDRGLEWDLRLKKVRPACSLARLLACSPARLLACLLAHHECVGGLCGALHRPGPGVGLPPERNALPHVSRRTCALLAACSLACLLACSPARLLACTS